MNALMNSVHESHSKSRLATIVAVLCVALTSYAADSAVQVQLNTKNAGPRSIESLTERGILRDYRFAWTSMAQALELNTLDPLEGPFAGEAKQQLREAVTSQQQTSLTQQYGSQTHRLEAVFYAPEGDVMELHDTAEYELRVSDAGKIIHDEHVVMHFIVLMTPAADRWVVRQLQAVPQF
jgi:hemin uptake protein HemP